MQKGIWLRKNKIRNIYPYLSDNMECDVVIVGGGISGAITAYFLAKDGFKIAVIEKNLIGYQTTGVSSACVTDFIDELYIKSAANKEKNKIYYHHSGYPGGLKTTTPSELRKRRPIAIIEKAVKGMIPHTKLGAKQFKNLYVYAGSEHKHEAQKPKKLEVK